MRLASCLLGTIALFVYQAARTLAVGAVLLLAIDDIVHNGLWNVREPSQNGFPVACMGYHARGKTPWKNVSIYVHLSLLSLQVTAENED